MCTVCGCADIDGKATGHHHHGDGHPHHHNHGHDHHGHEHDHHHHAHDLDFGADAAGLHVEGFSQARLIEIETGILSKNDAIAARNRVRLMQTGTLALNLVSSPGSGKTALLVETVRQLMATKAVGVIEGDQQTANDADRIRATGAPALQINTGKGCHLDASMIERAFVEMPPQPRGVLFIENVGNLVCPAAFDLGEKAKVAILSVTEGEDKPLKYPDMFAAASLVLINKVDLLPYVDFDIAQCEVNIARINPRAEIIRVSARTGEGLNRWLAWIEHAAEHVVADAILATQGSLAALDPAQA